MTTPGRLVVLNGVSSAGKSTLATAFRDARASAGEFWLLMGIDDVLSKVPVQWLDLGYAAGPGVAARDGLWFEDTPAGRRLRVGPVCRRLLGVYHGSAAMAARSGMDVIVDDVVIDATTFDSWQRALAGLDVTWVGVRCPLDVAVRREVERGDRPIGMAAAQHDVVHEGIPYAFEIDTAALDPTEALAALQRGLDIA